MNPRRLLHVAIKRGVALLLRLFGADRDQITHTLVIGKHLAKATLRRDPGAARGALTDLHAEYPASRVLRRAARFGWPKADLEAIAAKLDRGNADRRTALRARVVTLLATWRQAAAGELSGLSTRELLGQLDAELRAAAPERIWLTAAVLLAELPEVVTVQQATRQVRLHGTAPLLLELFWSASSGRSGWTAVRVLDSQVVVDLHHTARTDLATGIQRVARQTAQRWHRDHNPLLVGWTDGYTALRELTDAERCTALHGGVSETEPATDADTIVVPWQCTFLLPELMTEFARIARAEALLRFGGGTSGVIGFDCVPITTAETIGAAMGAAFANAMAAVAYSTRVAPISHGAGTEYAGWRAMLAGTGLPGPLLGVVALPTEPYSASAETVEAARTELLTDDLPLVLCVGSHEPRKNHGAVLHAAELLWREGLSFSLLFVGGNAWHSEAFLARLAQLQAAGRPVRTVRGLRDELLWAAYELAHCTVFPSLNEGFGLPVAESLAAGTPVITSDFGSMREIAAPGGALLVDPRDDRSVRAALRRLLTDSALHAQLSVQAQARGHRTWEHYADETWTYLVNGGNE